MAICFPAIRFDRKFIFARGRDSHRRAIADAGSCGARHQRRPDAMPTGTETVLYSFGVGPTAGKCKINDGADPKGSLTYVTATGLLFGTTSTTTSEGNGDGTIFQIMPNGAGYVVDHFFTGAKTDGNDPQHNAMTLVGTVLYGTTLTGGQHNNGSIFSINDDGTGYSSPPLFDFPASATNNAGDQPFSNFVAVGSVLYGMTSQGGHNGGSTGDGAIFSFDTSSDTYTRLHSFSGTHGSDPHGPAHSRSQRPHVLRHDTDRRQRDVGVVFSFNMSKNKYKVLHNFSCPGSGSPMCTRLQQRRHTRPRHAGAEQHDAVRLDDFRRQVRQRHAFFDPYRRHAFQNSAEFRQAGHQRRHKSVRLAAAQRHHALRHDQVGRQQGQWHRFSNQYGRHRLRSNLGIPELRPTPPSRSTTSSWWTTRSTG